MPRVTAAWPPYGEAAAAWPPHSSSCDTKLAVAILSDIVPQFYLLTHNVPPRPLYLRAKVRQRLAQVGAVALKNSVYVLPKNDDALEDFQWIAQEVIAGGGTAHIVEANFVSPPADQIVATFRNERDADYETLAAEAREARKRGRAADAAGVVAKLTKRLDEIRRIDFFDAPKRAAAEEAIAALDARASGKEKPRMLKERPDLTGRTWVTRPGVKIDRIATAWFVRRFIDPKAKFRFASPDARSTKDELRFDMIGGDFTHDGDRCTLETLIRTVGLPDRGVKAIAEIVHDLDLKDGKFGRPEAAGIARMIEGLVARYAKDEERLDHGFAMFDDLHEAMTRKK